MSKDFEIKFDRNDDKKLKAILDLTPLKLNSDGLIEIESIAQDMRSFMIRSMQTTPRTGRLIKKFSKSRKVGKNKRKGGVRVFSAMKAVRRSSPGNPPAPDTNSLIDSVLVESGKGKGIVLGVGVEYAEALETGTENMKARPFFEPTIDEFKPLILPRIASAMGKSIEELRSRL
jgi:HK97 gp10 family phage protein